MEIEAAALVTFVDEFGQPVDVTNWHWFLDVYRLVPPNPYWTRQAAAAVVSQHLNQRRFAEVTGGEAVARIADANTKVVEEFTDRLLATPFDPYGLFVGIVVVFPPLPPGPPYPWDLSRGLRGSDLVVAGVEFQRAAQELAKSEADAKSQGTAAKSESVAFEAAAEKLIREGMFRLAAKSR